MKYFKFKDKIFIKHLWESTKFSARRLIKEFPNKNWKRRTLDNYVKVAHTQPIRSNALQNVHMVGDSHLKLQITLPHLKTRLRRSCIVCKKDTRQ